MAEDNKTDSTANGNKIAEDNKTDSAANGNKTGVVTGPVEPVNVRLAAHFVMLTVDGMKDGKFNDGGIGVKTGDRWTWFTYTDIKKLMDACIVNKKQFNMQLAKERTRAGVTDL